MPVKREYKAIEINVVDGGVLAPDYPPDRIGQADYRAKENWRYDNGAEVEREGWADYRPNAAIAATTSRAMGTEVVQIGEAVRANGEAVPVGVSADKIYYWNWTTGAWTQIGSGYSTTPARRWQIVSLGSYVVFNNGTDLMCSWVIGDAAVTPNYEFREQGYACVDDISESNGMLLCFGITEILPAELSGILNGADPYGLVDASKVQRVAYRKLWSNIGNPRDFAATVPATGTAGTPTLTLDWPMASFQNGDELTIVGAGAAGGNLVANISNIVGTTVTLDTNLVTSVTGGATQKTTALNSVVGYLDLEDDGSEILRGMPLQNRVVVYKSSGQIFVGYYTGDLDQPWIYDRVYAPRDKPRTMRFPYTLVDVGGRYHLYAGERHFYTFSLGSQEPQIHPVLRHCERTLFFDKIAAYTTDYSTIKNQVYAAVNGCTSEVFFSFPAASLLVAHALVYDFENERASTVTEFDFTCAATVRKPTALKTSDQQEMYFIMGRSNGRVATYGRTNLNLLTMTRYGAAFDRILESGHLGFGQPRHEKALRSYEVVSQLADAQISVTLYGIDRTAKAWNTLDTFTLNGVGEGGLKTAHYLYAYFKDRITSNSGLGARISGRVWDVGLVPGQGITKL